jgi:hypothetical protein
VAGSTTWTPATSFRHTIGPHALMYWFGEGAGRVHRGWRRSAE